MDPLDEFIRSTQHLPPAPVILDRLGPLLAQPESDSVRIVEVISYDPALSANVIRMSNSAYYGTSERISSVNEAVMRVGFGEIYRMVSTVLTTARSRPTPVKSPAQAGRVTATDLWKHSVTTAIAARAIARDFGYDDQAAFTVALLHDIGITVLTEALRNRYTDLIHEVEAKSWPLLETESKRFGVDHSEIGSRLLQFWGFSPQFVLSIRHHHRPAEAQPYEKTAALIYIANMMSCFMGYQYVSIPFSTRGREEALAILGMNTRQMLSYLTLVYEEFETVEGVIQPNSRGS